MIAKYRIIFEKCNIVLQKKHSKKIISDQRWKNNLRKRVNSIKKTCKFLKMIYFNKRFYYGLVTP